MFFSLVRILSFFESLEYLIRSRARTVKVWDYQTKACVQTIQGHLQYVSSVCYHPEMPLLMSSSEDGTVRIYNSNTYGLVKQLSYGYH